MQGKGAGGRATAGPFGKAWGAVLPSGRSL